MSVSTNDLLYHCYGCGYIDNVESDKCPICGGTRTVEVFEY